MGVGLDRTREPAETAPGGGWGLLFWIVFARSDNPMALLTPDRRYLAINRAWVTLIGYRREAVIGRRLDTVLVPDAPGSLDAAWRQLEHRGEWEGERTIVTADGQQVMVQYAMRSVRIDGREVVLSVILQSSHDLMRTSQADSWQAGMLSPREIEIVGHVAMGQRAREIADDLGIAESTVKTHLRNAMRKVGARSQAQLVALVCCGQVPSTTVPAGPSLAR
jgi:PAS domain S-box-containing protein